jgi:hypothetical protein
MMTTSSYFELVFIRDLMNIKNVYKSIGEKVSNNIQ